MGQLDFVGLLFGLSLVVASLFAFYIARPRGDEVVRFLRNDIVQSYYVALVVGVFVLGSASIVASLMAVDTLSGFKQ